MAKEYQMQLHIAYMCSQPTRINDLKEKLPELQRSQGRRVMQNVKTRQTEGISRAEGSLTKDSAEPFLCLIKGFCTLKTLLFPAAHV
jgi:hypothetical protein